MKIDTEKLSGLFAYIGIAGAFFASVAMIADLVNPKWGAICLVVSNAISAFTKRVQHVGRKRKIPTKIISSGLIVVFALLATACPDRPALERAAAASYRLSGLTAQVIKETRRSFESGEISLETKDRLAAALLNLSRAEKGFIAAIKELRAIEKATGSLPAGKLAALSIIFNETISTPFFDILKMIAPGGSVQIASALAAVRAVIELIAATFSEV